VSQKTVWLYGTHAVKSALLNPKRRIMRGLVSAKADLEAYGPLRAGVSWRVADKRAFEEIFGFGAVHQGVAIETVSLPTLHLEDLDAAQSLPPVILALDQVTDPHNVGAIMRSAAAFGVKHMVMQDRHSPDQLPTLAKTASGALEHVEIISVVNLSRALEDLKKKGYWVAGLDERGQTLGEKPLPSPLVLVLGAEGKGLRPLVAKTCDMSVRLPTSDAFPTLNVSAAAAIALFAATRGA